MSTDNKYNTTDGNKPNYIGYYEGEHLSSAVHYVLNNKESRKAIKEIQMFGQLSPLKNEEPKLEIGLRIICHDGYIKTIVMTDTTNPNGIVDEILKKGDEEINKILSNKSSETLTPPNIHDAE